MADRGTPAGGARRGTEAEHEAVPREARDPSVREGDVDEGVTEGSAWKPLGAIALALGLLVGVWAIWFQPGPPPPSREEVVRAKAAARAEAEVRATFFSHSPVIDNFGAEPRSGEVGLTVNFTVEIHNSDPKAWPMGLVFNFGDHTERYARAEPRERNGVRVTVTYPHTYVSAGFHPVTLMVADVRTRRTTWQGDPVAISIGQPPDGVLVDESRGSRYTMGDFSSFLGDVVGRIGQVADRTLGDVSELPAGTIKIAVGDPPRTMMFHTASWTYFYGENLHFDLKSGGKREELEHITPNLFRVRAVGEDHEGTITSTARPN